MEKVISFNENELVESSGLQSEVSWSNIAFKEAMEMLFGVQPYERLIGITITEHGIKGHFRRK